MAASVPLTVLSRSYCRTYLSYPFLLPVFRLETYLTGKHCLRPLHRQTMCPYYLHSANLQTIWLPVETSKSYRYGKKSYSVSEARKPLLTGYQFYHSSDCPTFKWQSLKSIEGYRITLETLSDVNKGRVTRPLYLSHLKLRGTRAGTLVVTERI